MDNAADWEAPERRQSIKKLQFAWRLSITGTILLGITIAGLLVSYGHNLVTQQDLKDQIAPLSEKLEQVQQNIAYIKGQLEEEKELEQKDKSR